MKWQNWSGSVTCTPQMITSSTSEDELCDVVAQANQRGQTIRGVGSGHSFMPLCATADLLNGRFLNHHLEALFADVP